MKYCVGSELRSCGMTFQQNPLPGCLKSAVYRNDMIGTDDDVQQEEGEEENSSSSDDRLINPVIHL